MSAEPGKEWQTPDSVAAKKRDTRLMQEVDATVGSAEQIVGAVSAFDFVRAPGLQGEQLSVAISNPHTAIGVHAVEPHSSVRIRQSGDHIRMFERSEERRVGKGVGLGVGRIVKEKR